MYRRTFERVGFAACVAVLMLSIEREARADWFDTATSIIEQLVEDNIATTVVPNAAQKLPLTCDLLPSTIYALRDKRYTALPGVLRGEIADAIGLFLVAYIDPSSVGFDQGDPTPATDRLVQVRAMTYELLVAIRRIGGGQVSPVNLPTTDACSFAPPAPPAIETRQTSRATAAMTACLATQGRIEREIGCAVALLARDGVNGDDKLLSGDLQRVMAALVVRALPGTSTLTGQDLAKAVLSLGAAVASGKTDDAAVQATCSALPGAPPQCPDVLRQALTIIVTRHVQADVTTLEMALGAIVGLAEATCSLAAPPGAAPAPGSSALCTTLHDLNGPGMTLVNDVQEKNYGAAAGEVLDVGRVLFCQDAKNVGCGTQDKVVYDFLRALAVYAVDAATTGNASSSTEADFKQAAVELIEKSSGHGIRRQLWNDAQFLWVPEFSLRDAWWPGHLGTNASSQLLVYPSVEMVRGRLQLVGQLKTSLWPSRDYYFALHGSLLDLLGPVVEGSTRDSSLQKDPNALEVAFLALVVPRVDIEVGIPSLTENLVIGAGAAFRFFRAEGTPGAGHYCLALTSCDNLPSGVSANNFEGSVFVKYVP